MNPSITAQASQAAAQGQQMLADDNNKAADYGNQFSNYQNQANDAQKGVSDYTDYMKGAGSAGNQYDAALNQQKTDLGYDPNQMTAARANLNQATGALSAYSDFANTAASKWGMNAGGFAAANAGALSGINNNIASNQGVVNGLSDLYKTAQTGANQKTGLVISGEHETMAGLQNVYSNAANQRDTAGQMMNFYKDLASKQGGLNSTQAANYAQAQQAMASAQQAMAQAGLLLSQTTNQNIHNTSDQNALNQGLAAQQAAAAAKANQNANGASGGQSWNPLSAGGGKIGNFMANTAWGADASQAAHGVGNYLGGLFTGKSW